MLGKQIERFFSGKPKNEDPQQSSDPSQEGPLVGIVVVSHGRLAEGLTDAVQMIVGPQEQLEAIALLETEAVEDLMEKIEASIKKVEKGEGVLIFVDIPGASPFNASARIAMENKAIRVVSGMNLPMLAEVLVSREGSDLESLQKLALQSGRDGIKSLQDILDQK
ncbi:MAG: PTS sugar transporter subunit IIA [Anaerolineales bacterium]|nr:PTS sugar transporter subunit IIA [Anaerolineales bacterium]